jgi:hypothetical protein
MGTAEDMPLQSQEDGPAPDFLTFIKLWRNGARSPLCGQAALN